MRFYNHSFAARGAGAIIWSSILVFVYSVASIGAAYPAFHMDCDYGRPVFFPYQENTFCCSSSGDSTSDNPETFDDCPICEWQDIKQGAAEYGPLNCGDLIPLSQLPVLYNSDHSDHNIGGSDSRAPPVN